MMDAENGPNPVEKPVSEADSALPAKSPGQELLDRFLAQAKAVDQLATELQSVRVYIDAPKALVVERLPAVEPVPAAKPQVTSYFAGMGSIADFNDKAIARLTTQIAELKALF
jgi:hypothetical protein